MDYWIGSSQKWECKLPKMYGKMFNIMIGQVSEMQWKCNPVPFTADETFKVFNDGEVPVWWCTPLFFLMIGRIAPFLQNYLVVSI